LLRVTFSFFAGVWLYQMRERWNAPVLPIWAAFGVLFLAMAMQVPPDWRPYWDLFATLCIFPPLVAMSADTRVRGRTLQACAFVGLVSYGVYILHVPLFSWARLTLQHFGIYDGIPGVALVGIMAAVAVSTAAVLNMVYDVPVRRLLSKLGRRGSREKAGPAAAS
jgi:peptidoglycan/LPS O-acetylase OafA/YrhL